MNTPRVPCLIFGILCSVSPLAIGQSLHSDGLRVRTSASTHRTASVGEVRIAPSKMERGSSSIEVGDDRWNAYGYNLKELIAQVFEIDPRRIELPESETTTASYDVTLTLRGDETAEAVQYTLKQAIERRFGLKIAPENRAMDVYVLTAPNGAGQGLREHSRVLRTRGNPLMQRASFAANASATDEPQDDMQRITYEEKICSGVASGGIVATAMSIPEFGKTLEQDLDRVLVNETNLGGSYDFRIGHYGNQTELFQQLRQQLGVEVVPAKRDITVLAVRPA